MDIAKNYSRELAQALEADSLLLPTEKKDELISLYRLDKEKPDFTSIDLSQMWSMELFIWKNISIEELQRRMWIIREKFRIHIGDTVYKSYLSGLPESISDAALKQPIQDTNCSVLREDAASIVRQMQRMNFYRMKRRYTLNQKKKIPIWILGILIIMASIVFYFTNGAAYQQIQLLIATTLFGMLGSMVSLLQRLEQATNAPPSFTDTAVDANDISEGMSKTYIVSLLFSGAVFSLLVYMLSLSQLINILELLPKVTKECEKCLGSDGIGTILCAPYNPVQSAKLLILCFISGFAERFVPDVLDSIVKKAQPTKQ